MIEQAMDFREESEALFALLETVEDQTGSGKHNSRSGPSTMWSPTSTLPTTPLTCRYRIALPSQILGEAVAEGKQRGGHIAVTHVWLDGAKNRDSAESLA